MKPFTVSITRDILDQYDKSEISYTRMVELLNERAIKYFQGKCEHIYIEFVTEMPTDGRYFQQGKKYVRCEDCKAILPINRISFTEIKVPLYPKFD